MFVWIRCGIINRVRNNYENGSVFNFVWCSVCNNDQRPGKCHWRPSSDDWRVRWDWWNGHRYVLIIIYNIDMFIAWARFRIISAADIIPCQIDDPDRDACMKQSFNDIIPKLHVSIKYIFCNQWVDFTYSAFILFHQAGMKAIHIPPLDPLSIESAVINHNQGGVMAKGALKGSVYGFRQCEVRSIK